MPDKRISTKSLLSFHPETPDVKLAVSNLETPKQCYPQLGWGFLGVSRTALWQDSDSKESA